MLRKDKMQSNIIIRKLYSLMVVLSLFHLINSASLIPLRFPTEENETVPIENVSLVSTKNNDDSHKMPIEAVEASKPNVTSFKSLHRVTLNKDNSLIQKNFKLWANLTQNTSCIDTCKDYFGSDVFTKPERIQACIHGCHYSLLHSVLIDRPNQMLNETKTQNQSINKTENSNSVESSCIESCSKAYPDLIIEKSTCNFGCRLAKNLNNPKLSEANSDEAIKSDLKEKIENQVLPKNENVVPDRKNFRTSGFSILIPMIRNEVDEDVSDRQSNSIPDFMKSMTQYLFQRAQQMIDYARNRQRFSSYPSSSLSLERENDAESDGDMNEARITFDSNTGNQVSVQRSMSFMLVTDKDGNRKMIVAHSPPKVTIQRESHPFSKFFKNFHKSNLDILDEPINRFNKFQSELSDELKTDFVPELSKVSHFKELNRLHGASNPILQQQKSTRNYYTWQQCFFDVAPRMFYLMLVIMLIYIIIWLFCLLTKVLQTRRRAESLMLNRRNSGDRDSMTTNSGSRLHSKIIDGMYLFSNNKKYFSLSPSPIIIKKSGLSPSNSTLSFPPPYSEIANKEQPNKPMKTSETNDEIKNNVAIQPNEISPN